MGIESRENTTLSAAILRPPVCVCDVIKKAGMRVTLHSVFLTFAENPFVYLGMIVNAIVYVRLRWRVWVK